MTRAENYGCLVISGNQEIHFSTSGMISCCVDAVHKMCLL